MRCDRCAWYPRALQRSVKVGPVKLYDIRKASGVTRQALCLDHVKALRDARIEVTPA